MGNINYPAAFPSSINDHRVSGIGPATREQFESKTDRTATLRAPARRAVQRHRLHQLSATVGRSPRPQPSPTPTTTSQSHSPARTTTEVSPKAAPEMLAPVHAGQGTATTHYLHTYESPACEGAGLTSMSYPSDERAGASVRATNADT